MFWWRSGSHPQPVGVKHASGKSNTAINTDSTSAARYIAVNVNNFARIHSICRGHLHNNISLTQSGEHLVILMPRMALCTEINKALLQQTGMWINVISATNVSRTIVSNGTLAKVATANQKTEQDSTRTAGLANTLDQCVGAKIMQRRNKC